MQKYLEEYLENFSYSGEERRKVGIELEYPVVSGDSFEQFSVIPTLDILSSFKGSTPIYDDFYTNQLVGYKDELGNVITPEYSTSVLEIAFPPELSLVDFEAKNSIWLKNFREFFAAQGASILGYGGLPLTSRASRTRKRRYEVLRNFLGPDVDVIGLTASSQASVEVGQNELISALNVCNAFSGPSVALTANSSIVGGRDTGLLAYRESVWDGFASERCGVPPRKFSDIEEYLEFLGSFPIVIEKADGDYHIPNATFSEKVTDKYDPEYFWKAYPLHEGTVWFNARLRAPYGTIEVRPNCMQPHDDLLTVAALWLGIVEALDQAEELERALEWSTWRKFRSACIKDGLNADVEGIKAYDLAGHVLEIADLGLRRRGLGEETYLEPLWGRLERRRTPAEDVRDLFHKKGIQGISQLVT